MNTSVLLKMCSLIIYSIIDLFCSEEDDEIVECDNCGASVHEGEFVENRINMDSIKHHLSVYIYIYGSSGGRVVKLLACGTRGPGIDARPRHLNFQRLVISCFQVEI